MEGWSDVMAQIEHGIISMDLPSLPAVHAVPQVGLSIRCTEHNHVPQHVQRHYN